MKREGKKRTFLFPEVGDQSKEARIQLQFKEQPLSFSYSESNPRSLIFNLQRNLTISLLFSLIKTNETQKCI